MTSFKSMLTHGMKASCFRINEVGHETDGSGWSFTLTAGRHHSGTTRMHEDPKKGVVDPNSTIHGIENLYVTGSSVFPTSGYANLTLTVIALALRLAGQIKFAINETQ
jgi:choline dehydrogenase-like flavoprotein